MELGWLGFIVLGACLFLPIWLLIKTWKNHDEYSLYPHTIGWKISYTLIMFPISCFIALFAFAVISTFVSLFNFTTEKEVDRATYDNIHSIGVNNSVEGHFVLGCGSVEGKLFTDILSREMVDTNVTKLMLKKLQLLNLIVLPILSISTVIDTQVNQIGF